MLVEPLKVIKETYIDNYGDKEEVEVAVLNASSAAKLKKAYEKFDGRKGVIYKEIQEMSNHLYPSTDDFIDYCLGEPDDGYFYNHFSGLKGTNKNVTRRLYELFKSFEWTDHINQRAFYVEDCGDFFIFGHASW